MSKIRKAIIPAAGLGTRFLPATKTVPKEMLTIVDAPIILYVVEEAIQAGIEDIVLIQGRGKTAIEDFFDTSYEVEDKLAKDGKLHLLDRVTKIRDRANIISIRQKSPLGLGHAVLCGQSVIGHEPFAVLLGDEIMISQKPEENTTSVLVKAYEKTGASTVAIMQVPDKDVSKYGIADLGALKDGLYKVNGFIEKPLLSQTSSRWALPGRYTFSAKIFECIKNGQKGLSGEIQLTDAMNVLAQNEDFFASTFVAERHDAGDKFGYLKANIEIGLKNAEFKTELKNYIKELADKI